MDVISDISALPLLFGGGEGTIHDIEDLALMRSPYLDSQVLGR